MRRLPTVALVPLVLLVAACGGGSGAAGVSSAPASAAGSVAASASAGASAGASTGASAGASGGTCAPSTDAPAVEIAIADFAFDPAEATASVGDVVGWTNDDSAPHSAVFGDAGCGTDTLANGDAGALVFNEPGTYEYICGIHPQMKATLEVSG